MTKKEKELFIELTRIRDADIKKLKSLAREAATPAVLGHLFFNRVQGAAYKVLKDSGLLGEVNREFRNSLAFAYEQNIIRNTVYLDCVSQLGKLLCGHEGKYVMLKGAYLCGRYPPGCRTSNDIDLLVRPENVTEIGRVLIENGFEQGNIKNGEFVPASRKEIISSKMMRGETVPFIKEIGQPFMKYLEADINFSLDYKSGDDDTVGKIIDKAVTETSLGIMIPNTADFFIHLCCHLYKEASALPWVKMQRDMTLYKYLDIYMLLYDCSDTEIDRIFNRALELGVSPIAACTIKWTCELFNCSFSHALMRAEEVLKEYPDISDTVAAPEEKKIYIYNEKDIRKRFFAPNRYKLLKERKKTGI